jgi:hypothetical protein
LQSVSWTLGVGANVPVGHESQFAAPGAEYVFTGQATHCSTATAPGDDDLKPPAHFEHVVAPSDGLYEPATHWLHVAFTRPMSFVR